MGKEWILNSVTNRFQLNFKKNVGPTSENIRKCSPASEEEWKEFYYKNVKSAEDLDKLGEIMYEKINEVIIPEIESITEEDCKKYIHELVINRTYRGYKNEISAMYEILQKKIKQKIIEAPDEWDRKYNVDYYVLINDKHIGLQVKPIPTGLQLPQIFKEHKIQAKSHKAFTKKFGGKVFYVFSAKEKGNKKPYIMNTGVIKDIKEEIKRLKG